MLEKDEIRVYPRAGHMRIIDFRVSLQAMIRNLRLGGSEDEKGYGGFSVRMKLPDGVRFYSEKGRVQARENAVKAGAWVNITGATGANGKDGGLLIIDGNVAGSEESDWILREKGSMQNAVLPGRKPVDISTQTPTVLHYRVVVYKGTLSPDEIASFMPPW